jgi:hypothetical protein
LPSCALLLSSQRQKIRQPAPKSRDLESGVSPSSVSLNIIGVKGNTERRNPAQDGFRMTTLWEVLTKPTIVDFILNLPRLHDKPFLRSAHLPCRDRKITGTCLKAVGVHLTIEEQGWGGGTFKSLGKRMMVFEVRCYLGATAVPIRWSVLEEGRRPRHPNRPQRRTAVCVAVGGRAP